MNMSLVKKMSFTVNTVILALVFGLMAFFRLCGADFLVWFSIPTAMIYLIGYWLIHKEKLDIYVWMIYLWLTLYMGVTTVCLGYGYGFHLYCFSMIPTMFVTEYMAYRLRRRSMRSLYISIGIAVFYLVCTGSVALFGPIYESERKYEAFFWVFNALIVFGFLIYYTNYLILSIIRSEEKLKEMALVDRLTQLHNRHYMLSRLAELPPETGSGFIAMADIDNFKKINDTYGHNAGDHVLRTVSDILRSRCGSCETARWGGEEFLILSSSPLSEGRDMLEALRKSVAEAPIAFEDKTIPVTITIGAAERLPGQSEDAWIQAADSKLYFGKNNGKNRLVI